MSVRKRIWFTQSQRKQINAHAKKLADAAGNWRALRESAAAALGLQPQEAWIAHYIDQDGVDRIATFARKKDADEHHATVRVDMRQGVHTPHSKSVTVAQAAEDWIAYVRLEGRERSTLDQYRQHVDLHIVPRIGNEKLAKLTTPRINNFRDDLLTDLSRAMAKKVLASLKTLLRDAKRRGNVAQNVALDVKISTDKRGKKKLRAGVDFPTVAEVRSMLDEASGKTRVLLLTTVFTGLRSSELRGLRWSDVDLKAGEIHVRQRVDRRNTVGKPKSESGYRTVPIGPMVVNALREWKLACPKGPHDLVFPNGKGGFENHSNIVQRMLSPLQVAAGVVDSRGGAKYTGTHAFRHFYASWCINRKADGGLELPAKVVQERLGHSSILMTMDVYGHLFPRNDDGSELVAAESALLG
jgi:integrase